MDKPKLVKHPETNEIIPEVWKDIEGYEGLYQVSNYGRVKSIQRTVPRRNGANNSKYRTVGKRILKPCDNGKGYLIVSLSKNGEAKNYFIHQLVAKSFLDNPENKPTVNHDDNDPYNNHVNNLEWATFEENWRHGYENGYIDQKGEKHWNAKLTKEDVKDIKQYVKENPHKHREYLAKKYDVAKATIKGIALEKTWTHI